MNIRRGMSLLELIAVVTILGILATIVVPRFGDQSKSAQKKACSLNKGNIETQAQLWYRNKGAWPASDLSNMGSDTTYFPAGLPTCPFDNTAYQFNSTTQQVIGHNH